jgi:hypothetical protein
MSHEELHLLQLWKTEQNTRDCPGQTIIIHESVYALIAQTLLILFFRLLNPFRIQIILGNLQGVQGCQR